MRILSVIAVLSLLSPSLSAEPSDGDDLVYRPLSRDIEAPPTEHPLDLLINLKSSEWSQHGQTLLRIQVQGVVEPTKAMQNGIKENQQLLLRNGVLVLTGEGAGLEFRGLRVPLDVADLRIQSVGWAQIGGGVKFDGLLMTEQMSYVVQSVRCQLGFRGTVPIRVKGRPQPLTVSGVLNYEDTQLMNPSRFVKDGRSYINDGAKHGYVRADGTESITIELPGNNTHHETITRDVNPNSIEI